MAFVIGILLGVIIIWAILYVLNWFFGNEFLKKDLLQITFILQILFLPISLVIALIVGFFTIPKD